MSDRNRNALKSYARGLRARSARFAAQLLSSACLIACSSQGQSPMGVETAPPPSGAAGTTPAASSGTSGAKAPAAGSGMAAASAGRSSTSPGGAGMPAAVSGGSAGTSSTAGSMGSTSAGSSAAGSGNAGGAMAAAGAGAAGGKSPSDCMPPNAGMASMDPCTAPVMPNDDRLCKMMINNQMREFYIYASPAYNPCEGASMIMDLHGLSESIEVHTGKEGFNLSGSGMFPSGYGSGMRMAVQKDNALIITPAGLSQMWSTSTDVPFVNKVADHIETIANVNKDREYVTGISMGGMMTVAVGCDNAKRWHAMAPVAMLTQSCSKLERPTPTISFHSMTDMLTNYAQDKTTMESIAKFNNCKMGPTDSMHWGGAMTSMDPVCYVMPNGIGDPDAKDMYHIPLEACQSARPESSCVTWSGCDDGVEVVFCTVAASKQPIGGHILYNNDTQLDLAEVIWPFFKKFQK